jgi:hypothetical protein
MISGFNVAEGYRGFQIDKRGNKRSDINAIHLLSGRLYLVMISLLIEFFHSLMESVWEMFTRRALFRFQRAVSMGQTVHSVLLLV